ncbi:polyamine acetyltransferase [Halenospora varia]|nr:polyamine acetyltransferase [Halenospora varia]
MPRDLSEEKSPTPPPTFTESPNRMSSGPSSPDPKVSPEPQRQFVIVPPDQQFQSRSAPNNLHPYIRPLTINDLESCVALENAAFTDPNERATREKFIYRLTKCGELCLGIFSTVVPNATDFKAETLSVARPVESSRENGAVSVLLGHVVACKTTALTVTDESMDYPRDWDAEHPQPATTGHQEMGRTIALHSVAVLPGFQGRGIGQVLMKAYIMQMNGAGIADRLALIAHDHKMDWYEKLGFMNKGKSKAQFGGGGWYDMVFEMKAIEARARYG